MENQVPADTLPQTPHVPPPVEAPLPPSPPETPKKSNIAPILIAIILSALLFGVSGFLIGSNKPTGNKQTPVPSVSPSQTQAPAPSTTFTGILPANLANVLGWKVASFPQTITVGQGGATSPGNVATVIPQDWTEKISEVGKTPAGETCRQMEVFSDGGDATLTITPLCSGASDNTLLPLTGEIREVEVEKNQGNDGHDAHVVRYMSGGLYHYGVIQIAKDAEIDPSKDKIYQYLILTYKPDRYDQWLWTKVNLKLTGDTGDINEIVKIADSIVANLKLTD